MQHGIRDRAKEKVMLQGLEHGRMVSRRSRLDN